MKKILMFSLVFGLTPYTSQADEEPSLQQTRQYIASTIDKYGVCEGIGWGGLVEVKSQQIAVRENSDSRITMVKTHSFTTSDGKNVSITDELTQTFDPQQLNLIDVVQTNADLDPPCMKAQVLLVCKTGFANGCVAREEFGWSIRTGEPVSPKDPIKRTSGVLTINLTDRTMADKLANAIIHYWNLKGWEMEDERVSEDLF